MNEPNVQPVDSAVMDALDLPRELAPVQTAYWRARNEWIDLDFAYRVVVGDMLKRVEDASS